MLREGWDVKNVSIILGLRPFTSKANILPEQAVGRGLRLMRSLGLDYTQVLEIIGTDKFEEFVRELEKEGVGIGVTNKTPNLGRFIYPIKTRDAYNFEIPVLSSSFTRKMEGITTFDPLTLPAIGELDEKKNAKEIEVILKVATTQSKVGTKQVTIQDDEFISSQELLSSIANKIIREGKFNCKFNEIFKIVKTYIKLKCFNKEVDLESLAVRRTIAKSDMSTKIVLVIAKALGNHIRVSAEMTVTNYPISLMELDGFYWKRAIAECKKTVFNFTPVYNELEKAFAEFLERAGDITKFAALAETYTHFNVAYLNRKGGQSLYYPDFIAEQKLAKGKTIIWIVETKGYEDENVALKDAEAVHWCKKSTEFTKTEWRFIKIADSFFRRPGQKFSDFQDMLDKLGVYQKNATAQMTL
jgi:type III restriction enzyme